MIKINNRQGNWILFCIAILLIMIVIYHQLKRKTDLTTNGIIVNAVITDITHSYNTPSTYQYKIVYNGKEYIDDNDRGIQRRNFFIGKTFPCNIFSKN